MSERKFKVGDRVIGIGTFDCTVIDGLYGTVLGDKSPHGNYPIEFDENIGGHSCEGRCKGGHGWYVPHNHLKLANENWKVVIIPQGDKTLGRLYEDGKVTKSVETTKHPDDEYSIEAACDVIMERLFKPTYYNGKVVCVKSDGGCLTTGKLYTFVDGESKADYNIPITNSPITDIDDLNRRFTRCKFIEVVE